MKYTILTIVTFMLIGCSQKYYKDNNEISGNEYLYYKDRCEQKYQEYSDRYDSGGVYASGQKRHHDEYMRECMEVINQISLEKKHNNYQLKTKESNEINIIKMENNLLKISK